MDKFSCSHRCTSYVRLWSGARSVCQHRRVPLLLFSLSRFLATSTPVMFLLVLFELFYVFLGPEPDFEAIQRLDWRSFNFAIYNPAVESTPADADHLCHFNCREFRHGYNEIGLFHLSSTKSQCMCRQRKLRMRRPREYLSSLGGFEPEFYSSCRVVPDRLSDLTDRAVLGGL